MQRWLAPQEEQIPELFLKTARVDDKYQGSAPRRWQLSCRWSLPSKAPAQDRTRHLSPCWEDKQDSCKHYWLHKSIWRGYQSRPAWVEDCRKRSSSSLVVKVQFWWKYYPEIPKFHRWLEECRLPRSILYHSLAHYQIGSFVKNCYFFLMPWFQNHVHTLNFFSIICLIG